jgi:glyoxylase-like metal-dependent hydrolase (beta-lactamase superfamily II)
LGHRGLLKHFLDSLQSTIDRSDGIDCVFPGHGGPFEHLEERCRTLLEHHRARLDRVVEILESKSQLDTYGIAHQLFGEMRGIHVMLGCAEAQAHLEFLADDGRVACEQGEYRLV